MTEPKAQFQNRSDGHIGVVVLNKKHEQEGSSVGPNDRIWLSTAEQEMTASAPRDAANNPFVGLGPDGGPALVQVTELREFPGTDRPIGATPTVEGDPAHVGQGVVGPGASDEAEGQKWAEADIEAEVKAEKAEKRDKARAARARRAQRQSEETGAAAEPAGDPPEGEFGVGEEVGNSEAAKT